MEITFINVRYPQQKIILHKLPAIIGQDAGVEVPLQDSRVGGYQCMLDWEGDSLAVLDLGSRTGTFVNGVRMKRARLLAGDILTVGRTNLAVHYGTVTKAVRSHVDVHVRRSIPEQAVPDGSPTDQAPTPDMGASTSGWLPRPCQGVQQDSQHGKAERYCYLLPRSRVFPLTLEQSCWRRVLVCSKPPNCKSGKCRVRSMAAHGNGG